MESRFRIVWVNVLITAGLLLLLEMGSRIVGYVEYPDPLVSEQRSDWNLTREYDPLLFWRMQPGSERDGEPLTNDLGLRGPDVEGKAPGEFRILSLGESTTFGIRLPFEETYSARLEERLSRDADRPVRVVNAGVPGYSLFQGLTYLKHRGLDLDPDGVIAYFGYNDFLPISFRQERDAGADPSTRGATDRELFEQRQRLSYRLVHSIAQYSNFVRYLLFGGHRTLTIETDHSMPRVPDHDRRKLLAELRDLADDYGLQLAIIVPWYRDFEEHAGLLREFSAEHGIPLVDLPRTLGALTRPRADYFVDPVHPTSEGHALIAAALAEELPAIWDFERSADGDDPH